MDQMTQTLKEREIGEFNIYKKPKRERWLQLRGTCITSTEIGSAANMPKYGMSRFSIYHSKRGTLPDQFIPTERTEMGKFVENGIAKYAGIKLGARVLRLADFMIRGCLGASFDYEIVDAKHELDGWLVEVKNVDQWIFRDQWGKDDFGHPAPPEHITCQVQAQLEVARRPGCVLAVAVGGNDLKLVKIARDEHFGAGLSQVAFNLWRDIIIGKEPEPIDVDAKNVPLVYMDVDPKRVLDARKNRALSRQIQDWYDLKAESEKVESKMNTLKAHVLIEIGDAKKVQVMGGLELDSGVNKDGKDITITQAMADELVGTVKKGRKGYRRFNVKKRK